MDSIDDGESSYIFHEFSNDDELTLNYESHDMVVLLYEQSHLEIVIRRMNGSRACSKNSIHL